jgi:hypothetical protein
MQQASGSMNDAVSKLISGGSTSVSRATVAARTSACCAKPPGSSAFRRHASQFDHSCRVREQVHVVEQLEGWHYVVQQANPSRRRQHTDSRVEEVPDRHDERGLLAGDDLQASAHLDHLLFAWDPSVPWCQELEVVDVHDAERVASCNVADHGPD